MNPAVQKSLSLILLIVFGLLLQRKLSHRDQLGGIKLLILGLALPATIFVALLKIEVSAELLVLPLLALGFNFIMWGLGSLVLPKLGFERRTSSYRTTMLLFASLAPGLSCFPFVAEYLGEQALAWAALADVGNKVFVLILLYLVAMHWYYQQQLRAGHRPQKQGIRQLIYALIQEPVNLVIILALVLLGFGLSIRSLPGFLESAVLRISSIMTPLVLLFIGLAVKLRKGELLPILSLLFLRSGAAFCLSACCLWLLPMARPEIALLAVIFPQSACSFWPFAHISAVQGMEKKQAGTTATFDPDLALSVLAFSLPFSTLLILGLCTLGTGIAQPVNLFMMAGMFVVLALLPSLFHLKTHLAQVRAALAKQDS